MGLRLNVGGSAMGLGLWELCLSWPSDSAWHMGVAPGLGWDWRGQCPEPRGTLEGVGTWVGLC